MTKKIYTKTGDKGETGTMRGRMSKSDRLAAALGSIDELNSWIGVVRSNSPLAPLFIKERGIKDIQTNLFVIGSILAGSKRYKFRSSETTKLEKLIDKLEAKLPKINNFVYPVGYLQVARSVARRCERAVVSYQLSVTSGVEQLDNILKYLNRLSDALFVMARWVNLQSKIPEEVWRQNR